MQAFERVLTMTDYYDGPRGGIANFHGRPHLDQSRFDESVGFSDIFDLRPIDAETLALALEDWRIWLRWEVAHRAGQTPHETHPALPEDRARHDEIQPVLAERLDRRPGPAGAVRADFRHIEDAGDGTYLEVCWQPVE